MRVFAVATKRDDITMPEPLRMLTMALEDLFVGMPTYDEWKRWHDTRFELGDRELVIRLCAIMELMLVAFIVYRLNGPSSAHVSDLFDGTGRLSTFAAKIKEALKLKLIDKNIRNDLEVLKEMRNVFAHTARDISLESDEMGVLCGRFRERNARAYEGKDTRFVFNAISSKLLDGFTKVWQELHDLEPEVLERFVELKGETRE
jgi:hypothetical protein